MGFNHPMKKIKGGNYEIKVSKTEEMQGFTMKEMITKC